MNDFIYTLYILYTVRSLHMVFKGSYRKSYESIKFAQNSIISLFRIIHMIRCFCFQGFFFERSIFYYLLDYLWSQLWHAGSLLHHVRSFGTVLGLSSCATQTPSVQASVVAAHKWAQLLQGIVGGSQFPNQELNPHLLHCKADYLNHWITI